jgi:hypothetical protein
MRVSDRGVSSNQLGLPAASKQHLVVAMARVDTRTTATTDGRGSTRPAPLSAAPNTTECDGNEYEAVPVNYRIFPI